MAILAIFSRYPFLLPVALPPMGMPGLVLRQHCLASDAKKFATEAPDLVDKVKTGDIDKLDYY
jgi:hypothetical protein